MLMLCQEVRQDPDEKGKAANTPEVFARIADNQHLVSTD